MTLPQPKQSYLRVLGTILTDHLNEKVAENLDGDFTWRLVVGTPQPLWAGEAYGQIKLNPDITRQRDKVMNVDPQFSIFLAESGEEDDTWLLDWQQYLFDIVFDLSFYGVTGIFNGKTYPLLFRGITANQRPIVQRNLKEDDFEIAVISLQCQWNQNRPYGRTTII